MSQILSVFMIVAMLFSSIGGMTANLEGTSSFETKISVDGEGIMSMAGAATGTTGEADAAQNAEEAASTAKVVEDILNAVTIKGVADKESAELDLFAGEDLLFSLGVKNSEEGSTLATSLFGSQTLFFSKQILDTMQQQMTASMAQNTSGIDIQAMMEQMQNLDWEQIGKDFTEFTDKLSQAIQEKIGDLEEGEFTVDGMTFNSKVPTNITYAELGELLITSAKELAGKESVKPLLDMVLKGTDVTAELDKALEELKKDADQYDLQITTYSKQNGNDFYSYVVIDCSRPASEDGTKAEENLHFGIGNVDGASKILLTSLDQFKFELVSAPTEDGDMAVNALLNGQGLNVTADIITKADGSSDVTVNVEVSGMPVKSHTVTTKDGDRVNFTVEMFMGGSEKALVTVSGSAGKGGEFVSVYEGDNVTVIPFETLMNDTDGTVSGKLQMSMMAGIMKIFSTLMKNVPEDTGAWLQTQLRQMMNPTDDVTKTTETAPANP